jgi:hypothetical protein
LRETVANANLDSDAAVDCKSAAFGRKVLKGKPKGPRPTQGDSERPVIDQKSAAGMRVVAEAWRSIASIFDPILGCLSLQYSVLSDLEAQAETISRLLSGRQDSYIDR